MVRGWKKDGASSWIEAGQDGLDAQGGTAVLLKYILILFLESDWIETGPTRYFFIATVD